MADMSVQGSAGLGLSSGRFVNYAGGVVSLALIAGISVWGVRLVMRDVNGIPVVPAIQAEMRVAPDNPGGEVADHEGLSVNTVAAEGIAAPVPDRVSLAPDDTGLLAEDLEVIPTALDPAPAGAVALEEAELASAAMPADDGSVDVMSIVDQVIAEVGGAPLAPSQTDDTDRVTVTVNGQPVETRRAAILPATVPGVVRALRPRSRPADLKPPVDPVVASVAASVASGDSSIAVVGPDALPKGTRLAQLGAFDSAEMAVREWDRLSGHFGEYFGGRSRVIQKIETGGRTFYRLRVQGFNDLSDSRRFCSAIKAGADAQAIRADCIPVVVR